MDDTTRVMETYVEEGYHGPTTISVIVPVYNGGSYLDECLESIETQVFTTTSPLLLLPAPNEVQQEPNSFLQTSPVKAGRSVPLLEIQVSIYDDASTDDTPKIIQAWRRRFLQNQTLNNTDTTGFIFTWISGRNDSGEPKGGFAKNRAIEQSTGDFLCFCDADDVMLPFRICKQYEAAVKHPNTIIGSQFTRIPETSTRTYTNWANTLRQDQLMTQIYSSFGPTIIMPTWFCHRTTFEKVTGGFSEVKSGFPEDLDFFYKYLDTGGLLYCVDQPLIKYRFHLAGTTFSVRDDTIRKLRLDRIESKICLNWNTFSIWNAGKLGRKFYHSLSPQSQVKVNTFYDVDEKKIRHGYYRVTVPGNRNIPIRHVQQAVPPLVICVQTELTLDKTGPFQRLLDNLQLVEGVDYVFFN